MALRKPLLGYGPFSFRYVYPSIQTELLAISDHPHNWMLKVAAESGIPAFLLLTTYLLYLIYSHRRVMQIVHHDERAITSILFISIVGAILHNMVDFNFNFLTTALLFWVLLGLYRQRSSSPSLHHHPILIAAIVLTLAFFVINEGGAAYSRDYRNSLFPRNYFLEQSPNLPYHLSLNPHDARAWDAAGDPIKAVELDPMNNFRYYYDALQKLSRLEESPEFQALADRVRELLSSYEPMVATNLHFTAFTDNPEYAAKIYELLDEPQKADALRKLAAKVKERVTEENHLTWDTLL